MKNKTFRVELDVTERFAVYITASDEEEAAEIANEMEYWEIQEGDVLGQDQIDIVDIEEMPT